MARTPDARAYTFVDERKQVYKKLVVSEDGKRLLGADAGRRRRRLRHLLQMMLNGIDAAGEPGSLILPARRRRAPSAAWASLRCPPPRRSAPATTSARARSARRSTPAAPTLGALKTCTKAAHLLRRLRPLVHADPQGRAGERAAWRSTTTCASTSPTRARSCSTWSASARSRPSTTLLAKHGTGLGCDICKPAVGIDPRLVLERVRPEARHRRRCRTRNDYFLANMQKDGTYSVVPRVPGGEITPDKLIVIGAGREEVRPVHQDHRRPAHRSVRRAAWSSCR